MDVLIGEQYHKTFCTACGQTDCGACPHEKELNNPTWWLNQVETGEGPDRVVMWVKTDNYRKIMEEFSGKIKETRSERVKATGDKSFTHLEALLTELVEVLLPTKKCRVVMDYDPGAEKVTFSQPPVHDIPEGT